jgi:hypothetical protein
MKPIERFEPVDADIVRLIGDALGTIGVMTVSLNEVDISTGCGIIDGNTRCLWTKDGHRIEVWQSNDGGFGASKSKEIDPNKPTGVRT